jgi:hypothetical protein
MFIDVAVLDCANKYTPDYRINIYIKKKNIFIMCMCTTFNFTYWVRLLGILRSTNCSPIKRSRVHTVIPLGVPSGTNLTFIPTRTRHC